MIEYKYIITEIGDYVMDIAALSTSMAMSELANQVSVQVLAKSLDTVETMGEGMKKIMEMSVTPNIGGNIDISV